MTIREHLEELRGRLVKSLAAVGVGFGLALWQIERVVAFMMRPLQALIENKSLDIEVIQTKVFSGFTGSLKISFFAGLVGASPLILYQLWAFISAGLYRQERRVVKYYAIPGFLLFFTGVWTAYGFVMPWALQFLISWADGLDVSSKLEFSNLVSLIAFAMFIFGILFQLPIVMVFLMRIGVVEPDTFRKHRRHAVVANFTVAMILTPPDIFSQIVLALCMTVLYEAAILVGSTIAKPRGNESS